MFENGGASPEQIETFLESLKKVELLQRDFPKVQLGEIKWRKQNKEESATFTVLALPKKNETEEASNSSKDKNSGAEG